MHYQVNLPSDFLHGIRDGFAEIILHGIGAVNSILRREFEVLSSGLQVKIEFIAYFKVGQLHSMA